MNKIKLLEIDEKIICRYLGYNGNEPDKHIGNIIQLCKQEIISLAIPKYNYKVFNIEIKQNEVCVKDTALSLPGKSITRHLSGCKKAIFLCATLGTSIDKYIRRCELQDLVKALVADATASVAIDSFCDEIEKELNEIYKGMEFTFRFGLGYGDLPLALEPIFLNILEAEKKAGICSNENFLLSPRKSVVCVIGLKEQKCFGNGELK